MELVYKTAKNESKLKREAIMATVVKTSGSTPQKPGARLLVKSDGSAVGTLGGGCVEGDIWFLAKEILKSGRPAE
ncbi:MAG: XdhC family protein, partial [Dehalococcoidia bacterium]|nr:XdhC family protein [Dehalococcoidia bacterium]